MCPTNFTVMFVLCLLRMYVVVQWSTAAWIILSAVSAFALNFLTQFYAIVIAFVAFVSSSLCAAIVSAISVSLYPTNIRAMATCFIFMFGRIGGLAGGNLIGALVENRCNTIFNMYGVLSIGMWNNSAFQLMLKQRLLSAKSWIDILTFLFEFLTVCALVFLLIKKEPAQAQAACTDIPAWSRFAWDVVSKIHLFIFLHKIYCV